MVLKDVYGHDQLVSYLEKSISQGSVPHAQLFLGPEGSGSLPMAMAYAGQVLLHHAKVPANAIQKISSLSHPDLHFSFPVASNDKVKSKPISKLFLEEWRSFISEQPFGNLFDWYSHLGIENKQGQIGVDEASEIMRNLSLKAFEGGYKIQLVWMAEKLNSAAANKLLKLIEEPPANTLILLVAENKQILLPTIISRCQIIEINAYPESEIFEYLLGKDIDQPLAKGISMRAVGNMNLALKMSLEGNGHEFGEWFVDWVRMAFKAKGNKTAVITLLNWANEIAKTGREIQKRFLLYCLETFRQAFMLNMGLSDLVNMDMGKVNFKLEKFAPFIHENNFEAIIKEVETAHLHVERNGNARLIFTDLSIKLTRLIHASKN